MPWDSFVVDGAHAIIGGTKEECEAWERQFADYFSKKKKKKRPAGQEGQS